MEIVATSSGADLEKLTAQTVKALRGAQRTMGREIGRAAREVILADVRGRRRGGLGFSGMNTRLGVSVEIQPGTQLVVSVAAKPAGPWAIVEHGSKPHEIRSRRADVLFFNGVAVESVQHPGTKGHRYWSATEDALDDAVTPIIVDTVADVFEEAMG